MLLLNIPKFKIKVYTLKKYILGEFRNLHPYVAQRLVSLFETLSRKHTRLAARVHLPIPASPPTDSSGSAHLEIEQAEEVLTDQMREELVRKILQNYFVGRFSFYSFILFKSEFISCRTCPL